MTSTEHLSELTEHNHKESPYRAPFDYAGCRTDEPLEQLSPIQTDFGFEKPAPALSDSEKHRLVKASKCPTPPHKPINRAHSADSFPKITTIPPIPEPVVAEGQAGAYAVIQHREWADEYRIRSRIETFSGTQPPEQCGPRMTTTLSQRAARKIAESCVYVGKQFGGYTTFLTLTFTPEQRTRLQAEGDYCDLKTRKIISGTTIQREVSRFCDGLTKMWQRGWLAEFNVHGHRIACLDENGQTLSEAGRDDNPLLYCWVAEVPENKDGEPNPHVHMMIRWRVQQPFFLSWARRIEELWGNGLAHLEKIKDGEAAAAYMMKAAGYLCKAQGKIDQGEIRGNRYSMSKEARAPDWVTIEEHQLHAMGRLIADVDDHLTTKYAREFQLRKTLKQELDDLPKGSKARYAVGQQLETIRKTLSELPIVASKYQVILKGKEAFHEFMNWAKSPGHWQASVCDWLPEKWPGENWLPGTRPDSLWFAEFKKRHYERRSLRHMPKTSDEEWNQAVDVYDTWANNTS